MIIGANVHPAWKEQTPEVRATIREQLVRAGATSVRLDYAWATIEPHRQGEYEFDQLDAFIDEYHQAGLSVLLMLYWPPAWSSGSGAKNDIPGDPADYGQILGVVANRYRGKLAAIEMFNEPDLDTFWDSDAAQFAALLAGAYPIAKQAAPDTIFLAAAPTYLGLDSGWFEAMYASGTYAPGHSYDAQAIHPYPSPADLPPNAPPSAWSIRGIPTLDELRFQHGDTSPLWVTEVGWSTHPNQGNEPNWKLGVDEQTQATYTLGALIMLEAYGVVATHLYTDRDMAQTDDPHERCFGLMRTDNTTKPVLELLAAVHAARPEPPDPDPGDDDLEQRVTVLEDTVAAILVSQTEAGEHLAAAALALEHAADALTARPGG